MNNLGLNPYAILIHCDAGMNYDARNTGGVGYYIEFPEQINLEEIKEKTGSYNYRNINTLELIAINEAMKKLLRIYKDNPDELRKANNVIFLTDRDSVTDENQTSPYKIREWRKAGWENFEGKSIKNSKLLDELDKNRHKISSKLMCKVEIRYARRTTNKVADKLSKEAKKLPRKQKLTTILPNKVIKRIFEGQLVDYPQIKNNSMLEIRVYFKEPLTKGWEMTGEICKGGLVGRKVKIVIDDKLEKKIHRGHRYNFKVKKTFTHHLEIYRTFDEIKTPIVDIVPTAQNQ